MPRVQPGNWMLQYWRGIDTQHCPSPIFPREPGICVDIALRPYWLVFFAAKVQAETLTLDLSGLEQELSSFLQAIVNSCQISRPWSWAVISAGPLFPGVRRFCILPSAFAPTDT